MAVTEVMGTEMRARKVAAEEMIITITVELRAADRGDVTRDAMTAEAMSESLTALDSMGMEGQSKRLENLSFIPTLYGIFQETYKESL